MPKVFISYAHKDERFVNRLCQDLTKHGVDFWLDKKDIQVGKSISGSIEQALKSTDYFCACLSAASVKRPWVQREYRAALTLQLRSSRSRLHVCPLLLEDCAIPVFLRDIRCARFWPSYSEGLQNLLKALGFTYIAPAPYEDLLRHFETREPLNEIVQHSRNLGAPVAVTIMGVEFTPLHGNWGRGFVEALVQGLSTTVRELQGILLTQQRLTWSSPKDLPPPNPDLRRAPNEEWARVLIGPSLSFLDGADFGVELNDCVLIDKQSLAGFMRALIDQRASVLRRRLYVLPEEFSLYGCAAPAGFDVELIQFELLGVLAKVEAKERVP